MTQAGCNRRSWSPPTRTTQRHNAGSSNVPRFRWRGFTRGWWHEGNCMKIGFVINDIRTEVAAYATVRLARAARNLGHDVWLFGVADFIYDPDGSVHATAVTPQKKKYKDNEELLEELQDEEAEYDRIAIDGL